MIPDPATVAKRRHTTTIIVRFLIAAYGAWCCYLFATGTVQQFLSTIISGSSVSIALGNCLYIISNELPQFAILAATIFFERRIVRWIVPMASRETGCPKCGYSLKDLKSPICPECGTNLRD